MGDPVVHWELWSKDPEQLGEFYSRVFGWSIEAFPEMSYQLVRTGDESGIDGGIMRPEEGPWPGNMAFYIGVADLEASCERIVAAGGRIVVEPQEVPGMGSFCLFADPEDRVLGLWKSLERDDEEE